MEKKRNTQQSHILAVGEEPLSPLEQAVRTDVRVCPERLREAPSNSDPEPRALVHSLQRATHELS